MHSACIARYEECVCVCASEGEGGRMDGWLPYRLSMKTKIRMGRRGHLPTTCPRPFVLTGPRGGMVSLIRPLSAEGCVVLFFLLFFAEERAQCGVGTHWKLGGKVQSCGNTLPKGGVMFHSVCFSCSGMQTGRPSSGRGCGGWCALPSGCSERELWWAGVCVVRMQERRRGGGDQVRITYARR